MTERIVVVGASGFGREALDTIAAMIAAGKNIEVLGCVDDSPSPANLLRLHERHVSYLGSIREWIETGLGDSFLLAIGHPAIRRRLVGQLADAGLRGFTAIHPTASIGTTTTIGEGSIICAQAAVSTNVQLGHHVHVNPNATIGHDSVLADYVSINPAAVISGEVRIDAEVLVGAAATVLQNRAIGARTIIGAAALVTKDVPPDVVVTGVPGRWKER